LSQGESSCSLVCQQNRLGGIMYCRSQSLASACLSTTLAWSITSSHDSHPLWTVSLVSNTFTQVYQQVSYSSTWWNEASLSYALISIPSKYFTCAICEDSHFFLQFFHLRSDFQSLVTQNQSNVNHQLTPPFACKSFDSLCTNF